MLTEISFLSKKGWRSVAAVHRLRNRFAMAHILRSASKPPRKPCPNRKNRRRTFMPSDTLTVQVERCIYLIRGEKVMLDYDLAVLYGVPTKSLNLAVQVNIAIMRTFVRLREMLLSNADLARKLNALEKKYDEQFKVVFDAIRELMVPPEKPKRQIGFHSHE